MKKLIPILMIVATPAFSCTKNEGDRLWDTAHYWASQAVCWPATIIDRSQDASASLSILGEAGEREDTGSLNDWSLGGHVTLPQTERKLKLLFKGDKAQEDPREPKGAPAPGTFKTAVSWAARTTDRYRIDLDFGIDSDLEPSFDARYKASRSLGRWAFHFRETVFWENDPGWGTSSTFTFTRPLAPRYAFSSSSRLTLTESANEDDLGWQVAQSFSVRHGIPGSRPSSLTYSVSGVGYTDEHPHVNSYYAAINYRKQFHRKWLYYQIEPHALWTADRRYRTDLGIVFRLEVYIGGY